MEYTSVNFQSNTQNLYGIWKKNMLVAFYWLCGNKFRLEHMQMNEWMKLEVTTDVSYINPPIYLYDDWHKLPTTCVRVFVCVCAWMRACVCVCALVLNCLGAVFAQRICFSLPTCGKSVHDKTIQSRKLRQLYLMSTDYLLILIKMQLFKALVSKVCLQSAK